MITTNSKRHTPVPNLMGNYSYERVRSENTLVERTATPEEMEEILAKYGPPKMPLKDRRNIMHMKKRKTA